MSVTVSVNQVATYGFCESMHLNNDLELSQQINILQLPTIVYPSCKFHPTTRVIH